MHWNQSLHSTSTTFSLLSVECNLLKACEVDTYLNEGLWKSICVNLSNFYGSLLFPCDPDVCHNEIFLVLDEHCDVSVQIIIFHFDVIIRLHCCQTKLWKEVLHKNISLQSFWKDWKFFKIGNKFFLRRKLESRCISRYLNEKSIHDIFYLKLVSFCCFASYFHPNFLNLILDFRFLKKF